jgi:predicted PurR-regulated permease PerM
MVDNNDTYGDGKRLLAWGFAAAVVILLIWLAWQFLLFAFGGLLFAILLIAATDWVDRRTPFGRRWAFTIVVLTLTAASAALLWLFADRMIEQSREMAQVIPQAVAEVRATLQKSDWGQTVVSVAHRAVRSLQLEAKISTLLQGLFEAVGGLIVILVVGFFIAAEPDLYKSGLLRLLPAEHRAAGEATFDEIEISLRHWLKGQIVPMVVLGIVTFIGLSLLGIPLAFALSLLTAVLVFIPYIGALISEIPAVLVALVQGPEKAVEVFILYLGVHLVEGYFLTPLVQNRAARLPPVVTILSQALMWTIAGVLGIALAAPLAAMTLAIVKVLYLNEGTARETVPVAAGDWRREGAARDFPSLGRSGR